MPKYVSYGKITPAKGWNEMKREKMAHVLVCEVSGCNRSPAHAHHVFLRRDSRKQFKKFIDQPENMQLVCETCHFDGTADAWKNQQQFMVTQMLTYNMEEWWDTIPRKKQKTNKDIGGLI